MRERQGILQNIDWISVILFLALAIIGWVNIYAAVYNEDHSSIFDFSQRYGKQLIWIFAALVLEADKATLYLSQDGQLRSAVNHTPHRMEEFDGEIRIGDDNHPGPPEMKRHFKGWIRNISIYDYALSQSEIESIQQILLKSI